MKPKLFIGSWVIKCIRRSNFPVFLHSYYKRWQKGSKNHVNISLFFVLTQCFSIINSFSLNYNVPNIIFYYLLQSYRHAPALRHRYVIISIEFTLFNLVRFQFVDTCKGVSNPQLAETCCTLNWLVFNFERNS